MDLRKIQTFESLKPTTPGKTTPVDTSGPSFQEALKEVTGEIASNATTTGAVGKIADGVKFSNHAVERMRTRGISYTPQDVQRLNEAVSKAAAKGSKDSLILLNDSALIVSVKNNTVVTVMDKSALKENVFTNIDSTVVL